MAKNKVRNNIITKRGNYYYRIRWYNDSGRQVERTISLMTKDKFKAKSRGRRVKKEVDDIKDGTLQKFQFDDYFNFEGVNYSHIIDPESGYPIIHDLVSATIVTQSCAFADAIATTVMVMGFNEGLNWIQTLPDVECLLIGRSEDGNYTAGKSDGFNY